MDLIRITCFRTGLRRNPFPPCPVFHGYRVKDTLTGKMCAADGIQPHSFGQVVLRIIKTF